MLREENSAWHEVQEAFVSKWRDLGRAWGIPPAATAVHGLLLTERDPMVTDEVMAALSLSRGTAHTQLQFLVEWGLVYPVKSLGSRQIRYVAEKDAWQMMSCIARQRKKRELDPLLDLSNWKESLPPELCDSDAMDDFNQTLDGILSRANAVNEIFNRFLSEDERWWEQWLVRGLRRN